LVREFGTPVASNHGLTHSFPSANQLAEADVARIGLPRARANTIRSLAKAVTEHEISFVGVVNVEGWMQRFRRLPGIGDWTTQYVAIRALGEPDAFPAADLGLLHATGLRNPRELEARSQSWRPWRAYAAIYLWQPASAPPARRNNLDTNVKRTNGKTQGKGIRSADALRGTHDLLHTNR
jgi:AraC family transcriptional regulator of adaptative response / DNA-3-methyladenine glycosylase II